MARAATLSITLCFFEHGSNLIAIMLWAFKGEYVSTNARNGAKTSIT